MFLIAYKSFADLAGKGSLFVITILAARMLSPEGFGVFSLGSALGWILAVVADFGIQLHVARAIARRPHEAPALLQSWLRVRVWTAAGATLAAIVGAWVAGSSVANALPIALFALAYACSGLIEFLHYVYRGLARTDIESSLTLWQRGATLVCGIAALVWSRDVTVLAVAMLLPAVATLGVSLRIAHHVTGRSAIHNQPEAGGQSGIRNQSAIRNPQSAMVSDIWPIGAGIVLSALYFRIDVFLVQLWSGTEAVGLYNAVFRLVEGLRLFPAAVMAVALPSLCRGRDLRPLARVAAPMTAVSIVATIVLWASAGWLIPGIYQARYAAAVPAFRILLLSFPLMTLNMALTHQLVGWDGQRAYAALCAVALVVNVALNARLIPALSIDGAAWATLGTELCLTAGRAVALWMSVARLKSSRTLPETAVAG